MLDINQIEKEVKELIMDDINNIHELYKLVGKTRKLLLSEFIEIVKSCNIEINDKIVSTTSNCINKDELSILNRLAKQSLYHVNVTDRVREDNSNVNYIANYSDTYYSVENMNKYAELANKGIIQKEKAKRAQKTRIKNNHSINIAEESFFTMSYSQLIIGTGAIVSTIISIAFFLI